MKIILSLSAIAVILLVSSVISILEYSRMSNYVSELIAGNINSVNIAQRLSSESNEYNLKILAVIGEGSQAALPDFDRASFENYCDSLKSDLAKNNLSHLADSVMYSYSAYMLTSLEMPEVMKSDFIDTRAWYFDRLQPVYRILKGHLDALNSAIYNQLQRNSATFERGFYRSIIPGAVAVGVGLLLVLLLLFFLLSFYVNPVYKMLSGLKNYRAMGKRYSYTFDGDDELSELNSGIMEITEENRQLRRRVKDLRNTLANKRQGE